MTKTLSEQLCEICEIKPRYGLYADFGDFDPDYRLVTNERIKEVGNERQI